MAGDPERVKDTAIRGVRQTKYHAGMAADPGAYDEELALRHYIRVLWRRKVIIAVVVAALVVAVFISAREFDIGGVRYGSDDGEDWDPPKDERRARLEKLTPAGSSFTYTYDFGDNWRHKITVEQVTPADPSTTYPTCTGGRRARPPEDCGGVWGYENVLAVLADPDDEEHASMREWVGSSFDP